MKPNNKLPKWVRWLKRLIAYGGAIVLILILLAIIANFNLSHNISACLQEPGIFKNDMNNLEHVQAISACLKRKNGPLESILTHPYQEVIEALPNAPAEYVGIWHSSRAYQIMIFANGTYIVEDENGNDVDAGSWGVYKNKIIWISSIMVRWPPDINLITSKNSNSFSLLEMNGSHTEFTWVASIPSIDSL